MDKSKKITTVALIFMLIGIVSRISEKYFYQESLKGPYGLGEFLLFVGILMVAYTIWKNGWNNKNTFANIVYGSLQLDFPIVKSSLIR